jgi:RmlD substrate binding domain
MKRRIAVVGKNGRLGAALCRALSEAYDILPLGRAELDLTKPVPEQLKGLSFDLLINAAAATNVDWCELHETDANQINALAVTELGRVCAERGVRCLHVSTDYVFDGLATRPYAESDPAVPISVYGRAKLLGEELLLQTGRVSSIGRWIKLSTGRRLLRLTIKFHRPPTLWILCSGFARSFLRCQWAVLFIYAIQADAAGASMHNGRSIRLGRRAFALRRMRFSRSLLTP